MQCWNWFQNQSIIVKHYQLQLWLNSKLEINYKITTALVWHVRPIMFSHIWNDLGVNISERKSGTERTKKLELEFSHRQGAQDVIRVHRLDALYTDFARATTTRDMPGYLYPGPYAKHTQFYKQIHGTIKWWSWITKNSFRIMSMVVTLCGRLRRAN